MAAGGSVFRPVNVATQSDLQIAVNLTIANRGDIRLPKYFRVLGERVRKRITLADIVANTV